MNWLNTWLQWSNIHTTESSIVNWLLHTSLVVLVAWLFAELLARKYASIRYGIWVATCLSLLVLAGATLFAARLTIDLHILPRKTGDLVASNLPDRNIGWAYEAPNPTPVSPGFSTGSGSAPDETQAGTKPYVTTPTNIASPDKNVSNGVSINLPVALISIYALGVIYFLTKIMAGVLRLRRLRRGSSELADSTMQLARSCAIEIGLSKCPTCLQSDDVSAPMTIGILRPTVLLPARLQSCELTLQRHCLLHELAHVRHLDGLWNLVGEMTATMYWFHPAVHWARRKLIQSREYAADDDAIRCSKSTAGYSETLLALTQLFGNSSVPSTISATSHVERRIRRVLQPNFRVQFLPTWILLIPAALIIAMSTCAFQLKTAFAQPPQTVAPNTAESATPQPSVKPIVASKDRSLGTYEKFTRVELDNVNDQTARGHKAVITGTVTNNGEPVSNGVVLVRLARISRRVDSSMNKIPVVARSKTDEDGRYLASFSHSGNFSSLNCIEVLAADSQGRIAMNMRPLKRGATDFEMQINVAANPSITIGGTVLSDDRKPLAGLRVGIHKASVHCSEGGSSDPFARKTVDPFSHSPHWFRFPTDRVRPVVITDKEGKLSIAGSLAATIVIQKEGFFRRTPTLTSSGTTDDYQSFVNRDIYGSPAEIVMDRELLISTRVVDQQKKDVQKFRLRMTSGGKGGSQHHRQTEDGAIATTEKFLRLSTGVGKVRIRATFPNESNLVAIDKWIDAGELIRTCSLSIETEKGAWLSGRVITEDTQVGIQNASVAWHSDDVTTHYSQSTDKDGNWKLLVPRKPGAVSVSGQHPGYDLGIGGTARPHVTYEIAVDPADESMRLPDIQVRPIKPRKILVVDSKGKPVAGADVSAEFSLVVPDMNGKEFTLSQSLAASATSGADGNCNLKLTQSSWRGGVVRAVKVTTPDDSRSDLDTRIQTGTAKIEPGSSRTTRVVLLDHVHVRGKVLVDGKPHSTVRVGLAKRSEEGKAFNKFAHGYMATRDGLFDLQTEPTGEYSVAFFFPANKSTDERYYVHQKPITKSATGSWDAGTINIRSDQLTNSFPQ